MNLLTKQTHRLWGVYGCWGKGGGKGQLQSFRWKCTHCYI